VKPVAQTPGTRGITTYVLQSEYLELRRLAGANATSMTKLIHAAVTAYLDQQASEEAAKPPPKRGTKSTTRPGKPAAKQTSETGRTTETKKRQGSPRKKSWKPNQSSNSEAP
jgi:hypothetical protein